MPLNLPLKALPHQLSNDFCATLKTNCDIILEHLEETRYFWGQNSLQQRKQDAITLETLVRHAWAQGQSIVQVSKRLRHFLSQELQTGPAVEIPGMRWFTHEPWRLYTSGHSQFATELINLLDELDEGLKQVQKPEVLQPGDASTHPAAGPSKSDAFAATKKSRNRRSRGGKIGR